MKPAYYFIIEITYVTGQVRQVQTSDSIIAMDLLAYYHNLNESIELVTMRMIDT